jgi:hypothetical protein
LSCVGPYIFLSTLLSKTRRRFCSVTVIAHVSQPHVTTGRMIVLYICSLLAALRSLLFRSFLFANRLLFPACILNLTSSCIEFLLFIFDPRYINWFTEVQYTSSISIHYPNVSYRSGGETDLAIAALNPPPPQKKTLLPMIKYVFGGKEAPMPFFPLSILHGLNWS